MDDAALPMQGVPPLSRARVAHGDITWREAGTGPALVLLHGIGSGAASWAAQFDAFAATHRVIAWDAPGYGESAPLTTTTPLAGDYADALAQLLTAARVQTPVVLGHSLGALVAAAWAGRDDAQAAALVLASPARGYGKAAPEVRAAKFRERLQLVESLGVEGMAAQRSANLCAPGASADVLERVRANMARVTSGGYVQAAYMLAHDDLATRLASVTALRGVLCGDLDRVTPPAACEDVARQAAVPFVLIRGTGHACYVEDPAQFNAALRDCLATRPERAHA